MWQRARWRGGRVRAPRPPRYRRFSAACALRRCNVLEQHLRGYAQVGLSEFGPGRHRDDAEDNETRVRVRVERWRGKVAAIVGLLRPKRQHVAPDLDVA